ncbi:MAG: beta-glucosidase [Myxococcota bacterium]|jgi:beta-glucosidase
MEKYSLPLAELTTGRLTEMTTGSMKDHSLRRLLLCLACAVLSGHPAELHAQGQPPTPCQISVSHPTIALIDDFSSTGPELQAPQGNLERGRWFSVDDGTGETALEVVSPGAIRFSGGPLRAWGGVLGVKLSSPEPWLSCPHDLSGYWGLRFRFKSNVRLRASLVTSAVAPLDQGGTCESDCDDVHAVSLPYSDTWSTAVLPFTSFRQRGWGAPAKLDLASILAIRFELDRGATFEVLIDDLELVPMEDIADLPEIPADAPYFDASLPIDARLADLLPRMSLQEKIAQMMLAPSEILTADEIGPLAPGGIISGGDSLPDGEPDAQGWADFVDAYQDAALSTRLRIPVLYGVDAVHGNNIMVGGTVFPHSIAMGATRSPALSEAAGRIMATELAACGIHWILSPSASVVRDQRWGRTFESYGEHPELVAAMASAMIAGTKQAPRPPLTTAKHYLADGGTSHGTGDNPGMSPLDRGDTVMSESLLRRLHLPPYRSAVDAGVDTIMVSYSSINSAKMMANRYWLQDVLRDELSFDGLILSDWDAHKGLSLPLSDQLMRGLRAGIDLFMVAEQLEEIITTLADLTRTGEISEARIDASVTRILQAKLALGLFEQPKADRSALGVIGAEDSRAIARQAVRESLVLLKDDGFLPLDPAQTVCVSGSGADDLRLQAGGWTVGWQGARVALRGETIAEGIEAATAGGVVERGCEVGVRVVTEDNYGAGTYAEWFGDHDNPRHDGSGSCEARGGCVVVIIAGRPVDIEPLLADPDSRAVVMAWYPGTEGGGVADVLYGAADFTGKLPVTWARDHVREPVSICDDALGAPGCESSGVRYAPDAVPDAVLFPYGYGLRVQKRRRRQRR